MASGAATSPRSSPEPSGEKAPYGGPGTFTLGEPAAGLEGLASYRASLAVAFDAADGTRHWTLSVSMSTSRAAQAWAATAAGEGAPFRSESEAVLDGERYRTTESGTCERAPAESTGSVADLLAPARLLPAIVGAEPAGREAMHGVDADRFTFGAAALGLAGMADGDGAVWIATTGGYVLKEAIRLTGSALPFGENAAGTMTVAYEVADAGAPIDVAVPAVCVPAGLDLPTPAGATDVQRGPTVLSFRTIGDPAAVVAFYKQLGTKSGWTFDAAPYAEADRGLIQARADGHAITIVISGSGAGSSVIVAVQPGA